MSNEELDQIHAALAESRVYVHPALEGQFSPAQLQTLRAEAAEHGAFVVAYPFTRSDQFGGSPDDLLVRLHDRHPQDGVYLSNGPLSLDGGSISHYSLRSYTFGGVGNNGRSHDFTLQDALRYEDHDSLGAFYVRTFELKELPRDEVAEIASRGRDEWVATTRANSPEEPDGGPLSGVDVPPWTWALVLVPLVGAVAWRLARGGRARPAPSVLPPSAVARIREAHDARLERQAREELLALGEAIAAAELTPRGDAAAWQAALDHADAARRLLDQRDPDVLDVIGALVLCARGSSALDAALAGRSWTPEKPCFLNPLHGAAHGARRVEYDGHTVTAPLCRACDTALAKGRVPDILDVARRGKPQHYFETDSEPWATTGYGALHDDLVARLHRRR